MQGNRMEIKSGNAGEAMDACVCVGDAKPKAAQPASLSRSFGLLASPNQRRV